MHISETFTGPDPNSSPRYSAPPHFLRRLSAATSAQLEANASPQWESTGFPGLFIAPVWPASAAISHQQRPAPRSGGSPCRATKVPRSKVAPVPPTPAGSPNTCNRHFRISRILLPCNNIDANHSAEVTGLSGLAYLPLDTRKSARPAACSWEYSPRATLLLRSPSIVYCSDHVRRHLYRSIDATREPTSALLPKPIGLVRFIKQ